MSSQRQLQVNSLLQQELSQYWEREFEMPPGSILSVARVEATPALDKAFIYLSIWPEEHEQTVLKQLKEDIYHTQKYIDKRLHMKRVPKLLLELDEQSASRREVEDVLDALDTTPE